MNLAGIDIAIIAAYFVLTVAVDAAWKIMAAVGAGAGTVYMLRWFWWRINAWSEISAMVAAFMAFLVVRNRVPTSEYQMLIIAGSTVAAWVAVTYLTPPEKPEVLEAFYRKARPGGPGWRPVAARATDVKPDLHLGVSILLVFISSGVIYLTLPAVGHDMPHVQRWTLGTEPHAETPSVGARRGADALRSRCLPRPQCQEVP